MRTRYTRAARSKRRRCAFLDRASRGACRSSERSVADAECREASAPQHGVSRVRRIAGSRRSVLFGDDSEGAEVSCDRGQSQPTISDAEPGELPASSGSGWGRTGPSTSHRRDGSPSRDEIFIGDTHGVSQKTTFGTRLRWKPNCHRWGDAIVAIDGAVDNKHFHSARRTVPTHGVPSRRSPRDFSP